MPGNAMKTTTTNNAEAILFAVFAVGLLCPCLVRSQDAPAERKDFSHTNSISIQMVDTGRRREIGDQGLRHPIWAGGDAQTALMEVEGVSCGCLDAMVERYPKAYFSFRIDPTFKTQDGSKVRIDVEYFDGFEGEEGVFGLQYDATGVWNGPNPAYKACLPNV